MRPCVTPFFDQTTNTASYVVAEPEGQRCAIISTLSSTTIHRRAERAPGRQTGSSPLSETTT